MALFDENVSVTPAPRRVISRRTRLGLWALVVALLALLAMSFLPTAYVIQLPGPVYNTLGTVSTSDGEEVPLIEVSGAQTYPTTGALDLLTVQIAGSRERPPSWFDLAVAWFDPARAVVPIETVFPDGQTSEQRSEESAALMTDSQEEATAAALSELGYDVGVQITVFSVGEDAPARGILEEGDVVLRADGEPVTDAAALRDSVQQSAGAPLTLDILRDGEEMTVEVTPAPTTVDGQTVWLIGVTLITDYDFPIDVTIQLNNVGGPSAGMMFALGIMDTLTPEDLTGGQSIAGTGTITADGTVGPIGGVQQKMWGAVRADADYFLAPAANCPEVVDEIPGDLQVFSVATLDDALSVLDAISSDGDLSQLPTCQ